jgi:DNA-directed RNA polymerase specialized sigma24 family protein
MQLAERVGRRFGCMQTADLEDARSEALIEAMGAIDRFDGKRNARSYFASIIFKQIDRYRQRIQKEQFACLEAAE